MGKNEDKKMRNVDEAALTPNHKIASELQAIGERYTAVPVHSDVAPGLVHKPPCGRNGEDPSHIRDSRGAIGDIFSSRLGPRLAVA
jgi:hypothetical protein